MSSIILKYENVGNFFEWYDIMLEYIVTEINFKKKSYQVILTF